MFSCGMSLSILAIPKLLSFSIWDIPYIYWNIPFYLVEIPRLLNFSMGDVFFYLEDSQIIEFFHIGCPILSWRFSTY